MPVSRPGAGGPPPSDEVRAEWGRRVVAEYTSAAHTQSLVGWLIEIGASPDLIREGLRVVEDELGHAEGSAEVLSLAGGRLEAPIARAGLRLPRTEPIEAAVVRWNLEIFCLGETAAVPLFRAMYAGTTQPQARTLIRRIVADEARHRDFGWGLLDWMLAGPWGENARALVVEELPAALGRIKDAYGGTRTHLDPAERGWGLLAPADYSRVLRRVERTWWTPRFAQRLPTPPGHARLPS